MGSRTLNLLQQLSLQHIMVSKLCTDFTATLHLSPGLYTSYFRLSWFMSILYIMCASCVFSHYARFPCMLLSFVTVQFTPPMSQIIPKEFQRRRRETQESPQEGKAPWGCRGRRGKRSPMLLLTLLFLTAALSFLAAANYSTFAPQVTWEGDENCNQLWKVTCDCWVIQQTNLWKSLLMMRTMKMKIRSNFWKLQKRLMKK